MEKWNLPALGAVGQRGRRGKEPSLSLCQPADQKLEQPLCPT